MRHARVQAGEVIGELHGDAETVLAGARAIVAGISPSCVVDLDGDEIVFATIDRDGQRVEKRLPARDGLAKELVRHVAVRSRTGAMALAELHEEWRRAGVPMPPPDSDPVATGSA